MRQQGIFVIVMLLALLSACIAPLPAAPAAQSGQAAVASDDETAEHSHEEMGSPEQLGKVEFPVSCTAEAQSEFNHGMALLHSFWFAPAMKSFSTVAELDPTCAMAHWGMAMTLLGNPFAWPLAGKALEDGLAAAEKATSVGAKTAREAAYIAAINSFYQDAATVDHRTRALAYTAAMEQLAQEYPDDSEAKVFYALALVATALPTDKSYANQIKAVEILQAIFAEQPDHPGVAHYLIHANDVPALAAKGIDAALAYSEIAPSAPHALHMPSHIFTRLGYWQDSIEMNLRSAQAAKDELLASSSQGTGSYNALHAMDYLMYAYLQLGQDGAAKALLDEINTIEELDVQAFAAAYAFAAMPARYALERGQWADAEALSLHPQKLAWEKFPHAEAVLVFARGLGAARNGDVESAQQEIDRLKVLQEAMVANKLAYWAGQADIQIKEIEAWIALANGNDQEALAMMSEAVALEAATEKNAVTPGPFIPAHEMLGEMYLQFNQPAEALAEFEASQTSEPNRYRGLYGSAHAAELAGDLEKAHTYYEELVKLAESADVERPELAAAKEFLAKS